MREGHTLALNYTTTQRQRLIELDITPIELEQTFPTSKDREAVFAEQQKRLVSKNLARLDRIKTVKHRTSLREMEFRLSACLRDSGFVEVTTPIMLSAGMLAKMNITSEHSLYDKVYWLDNKQCLRPMLAPNLYYLMGHLGRLWSKPVRIFEIGPCFRKESKGSRHLSEFTMLNVVEMGLTHNPVSRLHEIIELVMGETGLAFELTTDFSDVYSETIDVEVDGMEVASAAMGPHYLDHHWDITDNWAGVGFGLERLVMAREGFNQIRRVSRSLAYLDGARLNV